MKKSPVSIRLVLLCLIFSTIALTALAQKLPNVQKGSVLAPATVKIDGKATEWDNQFQAYNHATEIFYTVSNDNDNLYLTVQATEPEIINKIIGGGITFTVQKSGKKSDKDGISVTYPIFDKKNRPYLRSGNAPRRIQITATSNGGGDVQVFKSGGEEPTVKIQGDSAMKANNKKLNDNSKYIGVTGVKDIDTLISVYNEDGIKAGESFDTKMAYTYELSINLKHLGISVADAAKFAYHLTINGSSMFNVTNIRTFGGPAGGAPSPELEAAMAKVNASGSSAATDFWGEYTLAKK